MGLRMRGGGRRIFGGSGVGCVEGTGRGGKRRGGVRNEG